jgi:hypothetical protein
MTNMMGKGVLSSMKVPADLQVSLYENADFKGRNIDIRQNVSCLSESKYNFNDIANSMIIKKK